MDAEKVVVGKKKKKKRKRRKERKKESVQDLDCSLDLSEKYCT